MICFHFTTFAVLETACLRIFLSLLALWFAFILLPLPYWKQLTFYGHFNRFRCDLLSFYYLCRTGNSNRRRWRRLPAVVICFHFTTFAVLETASRHSWWWTIQLWFAFILLPLPYWKQLPFSSEFGEQSCDLLSFYYLCRTGNSTIILHSHSDTVVICFHFTTFAVLETALRPLKKVLKSLWFAFILLPLPYWKQRGRGQH